MDFPKSLPDTHKQLLIKIIDEFSKESRIWGIGASGSYASDSMDKYSDLDLVVAVDPDAFESIMTERFEIIGRVEGKVAAFTGEHVGEPRLVIAMYGPDTIHVDFKFVALPAAAARVDDTKVLWERETLLSDIYRNSTHGYPQPDPQWIEDRFWIWIHYAATKVARGEYFESLDFISFLRLTVLGPLALKQGGHTPAGVRKIEKYLPDFSKELLATVAIPDRESLTSGIRKCIELYLLLRKNENVEINPDTQSICVDYFKRELCS
ncbi:MAG: nucleotidyltransferase domain-containing protein [Desulfovibrionaceae bacterium]